MNNKLNTPGKAVNKPPSKSPKFLNLSQIRLPITGLTSIAHRISGVLLFLSIPFVIYCLELSLAGPQGFQRLTQMSTNIWIGLFLILLLWAVLHHFCAGLRFLLLDIDVGVTKTAARASAWWVLILPMAATLMIALMWVAGGGT